VQSHQLHQQIGEKICNAKLDRNAKPCQFVSFELWVQFDARLWWSSSSSSAFQIWKLTWLLYFLPSFILYNSAKFLLELRWPGIFRMNSSEKWYNTARHGNVSNELSESLAGLAQKKTVRSTSWHCNKYVCHIC
jgi:hypothetical protein